MVLIALLTDKPINKAFYKVQYLAVFTMNLNVGTSTCFDELTVQPLNPGSLVCWNAGTLC